MSLKDLQVGAVAAAELVVRDEDLASALRFKPTDIYPPVFATSRMVAVMEVASSRILAPLLERNELSVGVSVDVVHSAPTPVGAHVSVTARYTGREDKLFVFEVVACDCGGEIGRGIHKRAVITPGRLLDRAMRRNQRLISRNMDK